MRYESEGTWFEGRATGARTELDAPVAPEPSPTALEQLANSWWVEATKNSTVIREAGIWQRCAFELRGVIARAVAPEPAQENQSSRFKPRCQHVDRDGKRCIRDAGHIDNDLGDVVHESQHGVLAVEPGKASSGEAAGGGVTQAHRDAAKAVYHNLQGVPDSVGPVAELSDREAIAAFLAERDDLLGPNGIASMRKTLDIVTNSRDAERAQKEALQVALAEANERLRLASDSVDAAARSNAGPEAVR